MATKTTRVTAERGLLLRMLGEGYDRKAWHGPNLKGSVRTVSPELAAWRPKPGRHNIAEIVVHCAYWKYAVRRRILGEKRGSFLLKGSNWFDLPARLTKTQWREYLDLLQQSHAALLETVETAPWSRITAGPGGDGKRPADHVCGIALHDVYHAGQVRTIKRLHKRSSK